MCFEFKSKNKNKFWLGSLMAIGGLGVLLGLLSIYSGVNKELVNSVSFPIITGILVGGIPIMIDGYFG